MCWSQARGPGPCLCSCPEQVIDRNWCLSDLKDVFSYMWSFIICEWGSQQASRAVSSSGYFNNMAAIQAAESRTISTNLCSKLVVQKSCKRHIKYKYLHIIIHFFVRACDSQLAPKAR